MIEDVVGGNGTRFMIAAAAVGIGLLLLVVILWFLRNRPSSPFIRGGRNRQPRLAVLDAAAVDARRRLVLVRRDDVEHLIMIGGPTDVVIESRIVGDTRAQQLPVSAPAPQAAQLSAASETTAIPASRPAPERREITRQQPPAAPAANTGVSNMGQMLYADAGEQAARPPVRQAQPPRPAPQAADRPVTSEQLAQPQPSAAHPAVETMKSPEDILDAARTRVLPQNASAQAERGAAPARPEQPAKPQEQPSRANSVAEFERILDAQITGDLGRLAADNNRGGDDRRIPANGPNPTSGSAGSERQEPTLGTPGATTRRAEPSLEDEMNRMLSDIAVSRKG